MNKPQKLSAEEVKKQLTVHELQNSYYGRSLRNHIAALERELEQLRQSNNLRDDAAYNKDGL